MKSIKIILAITMLVLLHCSCASAPNTARSNLGQNRTGIVPQPLPRAVSDITGTWRTWGNGSLNSRRTDTAIVPWVSGGTLANISSTSVSGFTTACPVKDAGTTVFAPSSSGELYKFSQVGVRYTGQLWGSPESGRNNIGSSAALDGGGVTNGIGYFNTAGAVYPFREDLAGTFLPYIFSSTSNLNEFGNSTESSPLVEGAGSSAVIIAASEYALPTASAWSAGCRALATRCPF
jgi:hypothetical protein